MLRGKGEKTGWIRAGWTRSGGRLWIPGEGGAGCPAGKGGAAPEILYFNDSHGRLDALAGRLPEREASAIRAGRDWLTLSGGDEHGGGSRRDASLHGGHPYSRAYADMVQAGVDLVVPGNHDLDWGWDRYREMVEASPGLERVLSHLRPDSVLRKSHHAAVVVEFDQHVTAIIGLLCLHQTREAWKHLEDPVGVVDNWLPYFQGRVDSLIILSHLGEQTPDGILSDHDLLKTLPAEVLVLGAHTHSVVPPPGTTQGGHYLQCGQQGQYLGSARRGEEGWTLQVEPLVAAPVRQSAFSTAGGNLPGGLLPEGSGPSVGERPARDGYRGECALINGLTDLLRDTAGEGPLTLAALCVRFFPGAFPEGDLTIEDWYSYFGYADCLAEIRVPPGRLPALLAANARRLLLPARYLEERGMLHFSGNLRYRVRFQGTDPDISVAQLDEVARGNLPGFTGRECRILTHGYVAEGMGGYEAVFREAGLSWKREAVRYCGSSVRDILWEALRALPPARRAALFRRDGRLHLEEDGSAVRPDPVRRDGERRVESSGRSQKAAGADADG